MKRTFTAIEAAYAAALMVLSATGCAFTHYGGRINGERLAVERLERKRQAYESQYVIVLNGLENHPGDPKLEKERSDVRQKIQALNVRIEEQRGILDRSIREWEQKILQDRIQKEMVEKEERDNVHKQEGEWNTTP